MMLRPAFHITLLLMSGFCLAQPSFEKARMDMVKYQIEERGIRDRETLNAMRKVPRHLFVPEAARQMAYNDHPVSIGQGQTISQPYMVAFMTQELRLKPTDRVLEIGTGSGYQAAVLAEIASEVYTIEIIAELGERAKKVLDSLGYNNINFRVGDGYNGWAEAAPFDAIIITAGVEEIPGPLLDQLAESGRMIVPVGPARQTRQLTLVKKKNGKLKMRNRMPVLFVEFTRNN